MARARQAQAAGDVPGAVAMLEEGLRQYPNAPRLSQLHTLLRKTLPEPEAAAAPAQAPPPQGTTILLPSTPAAPAAAAQAAAPSPPPAVAARKPRRGAPYIMAAVTAVGVIAGMALAVAILRRAPAPAPAPAPAFAPTPPPAPAPPPAAAATQPVLPMQPPLPVVRVVADLGAAAVTVDGRPAGNLKGGELVLKKLAAGAHNIGVSGPRGEARLTLETVPGELPRVAGPVTARGVVAVVVSAMSGRVRVYSSVAGARVKLDGADARDLELVDLAPGAHKLEIFAGGVRRELIVEAAGAPALTAYLSPAAASAPQPVPAAPLRKDIGMEGWQKPGAWTRNGEWQVHKGGDFVLFTPTPAGATFVYTAMLQKGRRMRWVARYVDERNHLLFEMDDIFYYRKQVVNGRTTDILRHPHNLNLKAWLTCTMDVRIAPGSMVHRLFQNERWQVLDEWNDAAGNFTQGSFGFLIRGEDELALSNFACSRN